MTINTLIFLSLSMPSDGKNTEELEFSYPIEGSAIWPIF